MVRLREVASVEIFGGELVTNSIPGQSLVADWTERPLLMPKVQSLNPAPSIFLPDTKWHSPYLVHLSKGTELTKKCYKV